MHTRRNMLAAVVATPLITIAPTAAATDAHATWDAAVHDWRCAIALQDAFYDIGPMYHASTEWAEFCWNMKEKYGSTDAAKKHPEGSKAYDKAWDDRNAVESVAHKYYGPADAAACRLVRTPAPDIEAVLLKMEVVKKHELHFGEYMGQEPWEIIRRELRALGAVEG